MNQRIWSECIVYGGDATLPVVTARLTLGMASLSSLPTVAPRPSATSRRPRRAGARPSAALAAPRGRVVGVVIVSGSASVPMVDEAVEVDARRDGGEVRGRSAGLLVGKGGWSAEGGTGAMCFVAPAVLAGERVERERERERAVSESVSAFGTKSVGTASSHFLAPLARSNACCYHLEQLVLYKALALAVVVVSRRVSLAFLPLSSSSSTRLASSCTS